MKRLLIFIYLFPSVLIYAQVDVTAAMGIAFVNNSSIKDYINAPENMQMQSETIGNYKYSLMSSSLLVKLQGYSPNVFSELVKYRREVFA